MFTTDKFIRNSVLCEAINQLINYQAVSYNSPVNYKNNKSTTVSTFCTINTLDYIY